jgi:hypothetical protein
MIDGDELAEKLGDIAKREAEEGVRRAVCEAHPDPHKPQPKFQEQESFH